MLIDWEDADGMLTPKFDWRIEDEEEEGDVEKVVNVGEEEEEAGGGAEELDDVEKCGIGCGGCGCCCCCCCCCSGHSSELEELHPGEHPGEEGEDLRLRW